jgi:hypothetical protein
VGTIEIRDAFHEAAGGKLRCTGVRVRYGYHPESDKQYQIVELDIVHPAENRIFTHASEALAQHHDLARHAAGVAESILAKRTVLVPDKAPSAPGRPRAQRKAAPKEASRASPRKAAK